MTAEGAILRHRDGVRRCAWAGEDSEYVRYHDEEWGVPVVDDRGLFEKLCLEGFQCGLSWLTILRKREAFRHGFRGFELERVARFTARDVERLLGDAGIVRHRGKIESAIHNARRALELRRELGSLAAYFWPHAQRRAYPGMVATSETSTALSKDLRKRGFSYVGPTTMYAFMQAVGLVNDHPPGCARRKECETLRQEARASWSGFR